MIIVAVLIVAAVLHWAAMQIIAELKALRDEVSRTRAVALMQMFVPGLGASDRDPRALLVWQPLAKAARQICPGEFAALDRASGGTFPFTSDQLQAAHAAWTADWLAWERTHDAEYKAKAAALEHDLEGAEAAGSPAGHPNAAAALGAPALRARLDAVEREKLDLYQRRYAEYVRVAKALQALASS